jgi:hypothetical protein
MVGALLALFMVFVLPACWFGMMSQARAQGLPPPSSANNNEEHETHTPAKLPTAHGVRRLAPDDPPRVVRLVIGRVELPAPRLRTSLTDRLNPAVLSVRRLL